MPKPPELNVNPPTRHCPQCGAPLHPNPNGDPLCLVCLSPPNPALANDTVIEENLSLSDVLSIVSESRR